MQQLLLKERYIHTLPGRVRTEVYGLKGNKECLAQVMAYFSHANGVISVRGCTDTGRILIAYDEKITSLGVICSLLNRFEEKLFLQRHPEIEQELCETADQEAAATAEAVVMPEHYMVPEHMKAMPVEQEKKQEGVPLAVAASIAGIGALGIKQLAAGKSALAASNGLFYSAAILSIVSGYPMMKRGVEVLCKERRLSADLVLGSAALGMALVRENLLALAAVGMIQYLQWKRKQNHEENLDPSLYLSSKTKEYAKRATTLGFGLAGTTLAVTRNPLLSLGVLLSANPRPCLAAEEYAWKQAEHELSARGYALPANTTLCRLAEVDHLIVEDTSLLFTKEESNISCLTNGEEEKVWCLLASLLEKTSHPLKEKVMEQAGHVIRTKRTAFHVEEQEDGVKGVINGQTYLFGSKPFMQKHQVDCHEYELEAKRQTKKGCAVYYVSRQGKCMGLIVSECPVQLTQAGKSIKKLQQMFPRIQLSVQHNSLKIDGTELAENGWGTISAKKLQQDELSPERLLFLTERNTVGQNQKQPFLSTKELHSLGDILLKAQAVEQVNHQHRKWTSVWNVVGTAMVIPGRLAAPLANLISDALKVIFLTRANRASPQKTGDAAARTEAVHWHALNRTVLLTALQTNGEQGLSEADVLKRRESAGINEIQPPTKKHWLLDLAKQFTEFTTIILIGTAVAAVLSGEMFDGLAMGTVLLANALISTVQERKAGKVVEGLHQLQAPMCKAIRSGQVEELPASVLVPGDIVVFEAGDRVPADLSILSDWNLEVNESALTGESVAVKKSAGTAPAASALAERFNMLYMGTHVTRGKGTGVVVSTGMGTEIGHLTSLLQKEESESTPLQQKANSISKLFVKGASAVGLLVFAVGLLRGNTLRQMIATSVSLIASAIPEGLPVTITIALSAGIYRMAKRNAVIKKLSALETLGRVTVICSDKTGTLTKNEMTVTQIATVNHAWDVTGEGYSSEGTITSVDGQADEQNVDLQKLVEIGLFCNNSELKGEGGEWILKGDPTEGALLTLAEKAGVQKDLLPRWKRKHEIPFDSANGTMSVVCHDEVEPGSCCLLSKGSVEAILKRSSWYQENGSIYPLSDEIREKIIRQNEQYAGQALRVLGFAYRPLAANAICNETMERELIYVGMVGMIDPPKADVDQALAEAFKLGVKPVMITGDHPITAKAIGTRVGMFQAGDKVLTGAELDELTDRQLIDLVNHVSIFARVTPEHKLRIVQAFRDAGHIVAMTGDGVNDAPAIKTAHVGIAMGKTGTEVTKQSADMVLKEDHFNSIVDGVKEGRTIISNIRKAIGCLLTGNLAEILVSSVSVLIGLPIPLVPIQILVMNLLTDALPATVLAVNPGNKQLVTERQDIVDKDLYKKVAVRGIVLGLGSLALFASSLAMGATLPVARTMAFATLVAGQLMQTFSWRQENGQHFRDWVKDKFFIGALGISWLAMLSVLYIPALTRIFHTAPLQLHQMLLVLAVGGTVSLLSKPIHAALTEAAVPALPMKQLQIA